MRTFGFLFIFASFHQVNGFDLIKTPLSAVSSIVNETRNWNLNSDNELLNAGIQVLEGYPLDVATTILTRICNILLGYHTLFFAEKLYTPNIAKLKIELRTPCTKYVYPFLEAGKIWENINFSPNKTTIIMVSGWLSNEDGKNDVMDLLAQACHCRRNVNFVAVDTSDFIRTLYSWSALNTDLLGKHLARVLQKLTNFVPRQRIHLVGHSLGAHIVGSAGRYYKKLTGQKIGRITGLDPAKPCFIENKKLHSLQSADAIFVDVVHTNSGVLGKRERMGHVDYYPGGIDPLITGCLTFTCAHDRATKIFTESIYPGNEFNYLAQRCYQLYALQTANECSSTRYIMGYAISHGLRGIFYSKIRPTYPFGNNADENLIEYHSQCGRCKKNN